MNEVTPVDTMSFGGPSVNSGGPHENGIFASSDRRDRLVCTVDSSHPQLSSVEAITW